MWSTIALFTAFAAFAAIAGVFARHAQVCAASAQRSAERLLGMRSELGAVEAALQSLTAQHRKLAGRVYADEYWNGQRAEQPQLDVHAPVSERDTGGCENYRIAQIEGPQSQAAKCECALCVEARAARAAFRSQVVPKTARGVAELARLNGSNDG